MITSYYGYISLALKYFRKMKGLRQIDVCSMAEISIRHYQKIESGSISNISLETLASLSRVLQISLCDLIFEVNQRSSNYFLSQQNGVGLKQVKHSPLEIFPTISQARSSVVARNFKRILENIDNENMFMELGDFGGSSNGMESKCTNKTASKYSVEREFQLTKYACDAVIALKRFYIIQQTSDSLISLFKTTYKIGQHSFPAIMIAKKSKKLGSSEVICSGIDCTSDIEAFEEFGKYLKIS